MFRLSSKDVRRLHDLLSVTDQGYYSLSVRYVARELDIDVDLLRSLGDRDNKYAKRFFEKYGDYINVFKYNRVTYIGLESRRIAYEVDERLGINPIAKAIERGEYD